MILAPSLSQTKNLLKISVKVTHKKIHHPKKPAKKTPEHDLMTMMRVAVDVKIA
jgi:hypothetical protein